MITIENLYKLLKVISQNVKAAKKRGDATVQAADTLALLWTKLNAIELLLDRVDLPDTFEIEAIRTIQRTAKTPPEKEMMDLVEFLKSREAAVNE